MKGIENLRVPTVITVYMKMQGISSELSPLAQSFDKVFFFFS